MICRRCGNRIPEYLISREYFQCPECGRQFGSPHAVDNRSTRNEYEPRQSRYDRGGESYARRSSRFEPEYDDRPADESYYDDGQGYYDDQYYDDGYYDDQPYDDQYNGDAYYDDQPYDDQYDDAYYDDQYYDDSADYSDDFDAPRAQKPKPQKQPRTPKPKKPKQPARTMKLSVLLYVLIAEVIILIVIACIGAGMNSGEPAKSDPTAAPAAVETTVTRDPNATESPYPVV